MPQARSILELVRLSETRKKAAATRLEMYHDRQSEDLMQELRKRWASPEDFRLFHVNLLKKVINKRATVYQTKPTRTFSGWDQEKGDALYRDVAANVVLKKASRFTKLCKTTALRVGWSTTLGRPALSLLTPNILDAEWDEFPSDPTKLIVTHEGDTDVETEYSVWTPTGYQRLDCNGHAIARLDNPDSVNPYGELPFVPLFDYWSDDEFFLPGGDDLVEAQRAINVALVNLWRAIELQSHGQAWAVGLPANDALRVGPDRTITLPKDGQFGYAAPNTPIEEVLKAIEFAMKQVAITNDLTPTVFNVDRKAESAAAKIQDTRDLLEAREDDLDLWRTYEQALFHKLKVVANTHKPGSVPESAELTVDFGEVGEPLDDKTRLETYEKRILMGIWSPVDALMADNPDIKTRDEAAERIAQAQLENDEALLGRSSNEHDHGDEEL